MVNSAVWQSAMETQFVLGELQSNNSTMTPLDTTSLSNSEEHPVFSVALPALYGVGFLVSLTGVTTNVLTIVTFLKMGVKDSVTISFLFLALSDIFVCFVNLGRAASDLVDVALEALNLLDVSFRRVYFFVFIRRIFQHNTILVTTFLAIQRVLCIVLPFKVKAIFNKTRTYVAMILFLVYNISIGVAPFFTLISKETDPVTNSTVLVFNVGTFFASDFQPYIFRTVLPILMVVCVVIMAVTLKKSAKFHQNVAVKTVNVADGKTEQSKERKAVIQVTLVCLIFVVTNIPILLVRVAEAASPQFNTLEQYRDIYHFSVNLCSTAETINSTVNVFVYYKFNAKFRRCLTSWCRIFYCKDKTLS